MNKFLVILVLILSNLVSAAHRSYPSASISPPAQAMTTNLPLHDAAVKAAASTGDDANNDPKALTDNGKMIEIDTLLPMNSEYTVESFLADNNIDSKEADIVKVPLLEDEIFQEKIAIVYHP